VTPDLRFAGRDGLQGVQGLTSLNERRVSTSWGASLPSPTFWTKTTKTTKTTSVPVADVYPREIGALMDLGHRRLLPISTREKSR